VKTIGVTHESKARASRGYAARRAVRLRLTGPQPLPSRGYAAVPSIYPELSKSKSSCSQSPVIFQLPLLPKAVQRTPIFSRGFKLLHLLRPLAGPPPAP
jgi:hypothetical protein